MEKLAQNEEVSLNQYIVYALTRQVTLAYTVQSLPDKAIAQQKASYAALLQNLGQASFGEIEKVMAEREVVEPDKGLTPDMIQAITSRIAGNSPKERP